ncbi:hypothetical protein [Arthrobacter yangruifuii]|uniref:hypothetical protein n=1 Tax=Arthrobacter yangruifuii TaxID=2606616 RepID=UPI0011B46714|nr:hypothetical protein [Arthrobacter yangruifuii]
MVRDWETRRAMKILTRPFRGMPAAEAGRQPFVSGGERLFTPVLSEKAIRWQIPAGYRMEVHGHAFVLANRRSRRLAEVTIQADAPVRLRSAGAETPLSPRSSEVTLSGSAGTGTSITVSGGTMRVIDRGVQDKGGEWRIWNGRRSLTYCLEEPLSEHGKSTLCVAFSAIGAPYDFTYNYKSSLAKVDAYRLYILDNFGSQGSYYYADHRDTGIFNAVQSFLLEMSSQLGIGPDGMVFLGSSKGGTAALSHGLQLGAARIIAGAPQSYPGTYLSGASPDMLSFIAGDSDSESIDWLDQLIPNAVSNAQGNPHITVLVGDNDSHKHVHIEPLMKLAADAGLSIQTLVIKDLSHQDIGAAFGPYLEAALQKGFFSGADLLPYRLARRDDAEDMVQFKLWLPPGEEAAIEVRSSHSRILSTDYSAETFFLFQAPENEAIQATVTRRRENTEVGRFTTVWLQPKP